LTVNVTVFDTVPSLAVMVTDVEATTGFVVNTNVAVVTPGGTVTLAGTAAAVLLTDNVTTVPPAGAKPLSVTVPVETTPPVTVAGLTDTVERTGGITVSVAFFVAP
jgi:hypothetical protein